MKPSRTDCPPWCVSLHRGEGPGQPHRELRHHAMYAGQAVQVDVLQTDQQFPRVVLSAVEGLAHAELTPDQALTLSQHLARASAKVTGRLPRPKGVTACPPWCQAEEYGEGGERPHGGTPHESAPVTVAAHADHVPVELDGALCGDAGGLFVELRDSHWGWLLQLDVAQAAQLGYALIGLTALAGREGGR